MTKTDQPANEKFFIWDAVEATDPAFTKEFSRGGGFKGTSINAEYNIKKATAVFGPNGMGWGVDILDESYFEGHPVLVENGQVLQREIIHVMKVSVWYKVNDVKHNTSPQFGQTTMVGKNKYGVFTDEEAPKKTMTDATNKCLALLGFGADIFLGMYDDNKYVNDKRAQFQQEKQQKQKEADQNNPDMIWAKQLDKQLKEAKSLEDLAEIRAEHKDMFKEVAERNKSLARQLSTTIQGIIKRFEAVANDDNEPETFNEQASQEVPPYGDIYEGPM